MNDDTCLLGIEKLTQHKAVNFKRGSSFGYHTHRRHVSSFILSSCLLFCSQFTQKRKRGQSICSCSYPIVARWDSKSIITNDSTEKCGLPDSTEKCGLPDSTHVGCRSYFCLLISQMDSKISHSAVLLVAKLQQRYWFRHLRDIYQQKHERGC